MRDVRHPGPRVALVAAALLATGLTACRRESAPTTRYDLTFGERGFTAGRFDRPRGIAHDPGGDFLYVVDRSGRLQKFTATGEFRASWRPPDIAKGNPEDLCVAADGRVLVANTHYSEVLVYAPDGTLLDRFGEYGWGPGQFIYPVGVATDSQGRISDSEYGENDRVQRFSADGRYQIGWGKFGTAPGEFQRPSGLAVGPADRLYVADAVNHRVQVFDPDGNLLHVLGRHGREPGAFNYPYDVAIHDGHLYVLEYGNQRLQRLTLEGTPVATYGTPGRGDGQLASPWRFTAAPDALFISDTMNCRVVRLRY